MSADLVWSLTIVGGAVLWVAVTANWTHKRRQRNPNRCDCLWCTQTRTRRTEREVTESEPHIWNH